MDKKCRRAARPRRLLIVAVLLAVTLLAAAPAQAAEPARGGPGGYVEGVVMWKVQLANCLAAKISEAWSAQIVCLAPEDYKRAGWMTYYRGPYLREL